MTVDDEDFCGCDDCADADDGWCCCGECDDGDDWADEPTDTTPVETIVVAGGLL